MIDEALGRALADRYRVERELGAGGMATVYLAEDLKHRRKVALKVLRPELSAVLGPERFLKEIALTASLQNAHILPLFDSGAIDGQLFYVMPFVDGESLRQRIARGPVPLQNAIDVLRDVARALAYAHEHGVVHRDIKPDNILLSSRSAVVSDFGIAKALSESRETESGSASVTLTGAGTSLGTPAYMSPEQALGDDVDARTDVYAWGVIAYELLAGAHPFALHTTSQKLIAAQVSEAPAPIATKAPAVPAGIATLVMQCLAKDPSSRPANGDAILERLAAPLTEPDAAKRRPRWPAFAALALVLITLVALSVARLRGSRNLAVRSVVVVPFDNLGDPSDAYFAEGMSDEIAGQLARVPGLQVIGRDGVRSFLGSQRSPRDIARALGAQYVLSGTVRWARTPTTRVRIVPTLLDVATGTQTWGEPYEETLTDAFKVQASVAERVAQALSVTLGDTARAVLHREDNVNAEARDAQLLGRYLLRQRGAGNLLLAVDAFQRAIALDSNYARAWAGLSEANAVLPAWSDSSAAYPAWRARADTAARRALTLDATLPEVQVALARELETNFRFREALPAVQRAIALDSSSVVSYVLKFEILSSLGRAAEGDSAMQRALALDSVSSFLLSNRAITYLNAGKSDSAIHYLERAVQVTPSARLFQRYLVWMYAQLGRTDDAARYCAKEELEPLFCTSFDAFSADSTRRRAALIALGKLGRGGPKNISTAWSVLSYAHLGMADSVFSRLALSIDQREDTFMKVITSPLLVPYQRDPRWDQIVGAMRRR